MRTVRTETAFHCVTYRVCRRRAVRTPDHWGVQLSYGYADGSVLWRLATRKRFWSPSAAEQWIAEQAKESI